MREKGKSADLRNLSFFLREEDYVLATSKKLERDFQASLIKEIEAMFKGAIVMKLDANYIQGIPDLLILYKKKWATLECKAFAKASKQNNQGYYVGLMDKMSFSRFICPENKEEVLRELQQSFKPSRKARVPRSK